MIPVDRPQPARFGWYVDEPGPCRMVDGASRWTAGLRVLVRVAPSWAGWDQRAGITPHLAIAVDERRFRR